MKMVSKKERHEHFVSNLTGGDLGEIYAIFTAFIALFMVSASIRKIIGGSFLTDFLIGVLPCILMVTVLSNGAYLLCIVSILLAVFCSLLVRGHLRKKVSPRSMLDAKGRPAFLSSFRGLVFMLTSMCILAVDFTAFPRRFAKTELFGTSIMDYGVGCFAFMMGLMAPETYGRRQKFARLLKTILPLLILGIMRVVTVKAIDYQEHISEYGTHWNFFFTLAFSKLISVFLLLLPIPVLALATLLSISHEVALRGGLASWIQQPNRVDLLTANKEGIGSLLGYVAILLWGVVIGRWIQTAVTKHRSTSSLYHLVMKCTVIVIIGYFLTRAFGPVSRCMANVSYIAFTIMISSYGVILNIAGQTLVLVETLPQTAGPELMPSILSTRSILNTCNDLALVYFLISNLLTGLTNFVIDTMTVNSLMAVGVLSMYQLAVLISAEAFAAFSR